jgi:hypothetical protein
LLPETGNRQDHALAVFNHNAHKIIKDAISYCQIYVNNQYYKEILWQKNEQGDGLFIYLVDGGAILPGKESQIF